MRLFFKELIHLDVFASIGNSLHHIVIKMSSNARDGERKRRGWQRIKIKISIGIFSAHFSIFFFLHGRATFLLSVFSFLTHSACGCGLILCVFLFVLAPTLLLTEILDMLCFFYLPLTKSFYHTLHFLK